MPVTQTISHARHMGIDAEFRTITNMGGAFPLHWHTDLQLIATVRGAGRADVWPNHVSLTPGSVLVIAPRQVHTAAVDGPGEWAFHSLHLAANVTMPPLPASGWLLAPRGSPIADQCAIAVSRLFEKHGRLPFLPAVIELGSMIKDSENVFKTNSTSVDGRVLRAIELFGHASGRMSLATVAAHVKSSEGHFSRLFRQATGMAPNAWQIVTRVERAKAALRGGATIRHAALAAGFMDPATFSRTFRRVTGLTPRVFRAGVVNPV